MKLVANLRFYILAKSVLLSLLVVSLLRTHAGSDSLFYLQAGQSFGYLAVLYLYLALLISPLLRLLPTTTFGEALKFGRRAIGVSAAYFASLHTLIVIGWELHGINSLTLLPNRFLVALGLGGVALVILLAQAATSFDSAITAMTFRRWKQLQRLVYIAGLAIIVHVWMIGSHSASTSVQITGFILLALLFGLEAYRFSQNLALKFNGLDHQELIITLAVTTWLVLIGGLLALPKLSPSLHNHQHLERHHE
ncbi:MAG: Sulfoxide reductase heme-binding subunit YedZ [Candidatus Saccharibacteria bacterium]|nr:Sulfoxide reductase heme-binding subunit YedZ [Candidatus Saccharibacteria bacterium]